MEKGSNWMRRLRSLKKQSKMTALSRSCIKKLINFLRSSNPIRQIMIHQQIKNLENRIRNKRAKAILFNGYFSIFDLYWALIYTFWFSLAFGIGNAFFEFDMLLWRKLLLQGFVNNIPLSFVVNCFYARVVSHLIKKKHPHTYSTIFSIAVQLIFVVWHEYLGTKHPILAILGPTIIGLILTNYQVYATLRLKKNK